jgi:Flp pilus assembly CpaE family ATPase
MREPAGEKPACVIEKQKIGVAGMSRGAGTTLVAVSLAKLLAAMEKRKVTYLEVCDKACEKNSLVYDSIGFDKRFKTREFVRYYREIKEGRNIRQKVNQDELINWGLITPEDVKEGIKTAPVDIVRLINNIPGDLIVCDIADCTDTADYLVDMDYIIFVIDPMPSAMIGGYPLMRGVKRMECKGKKVIWVINKYNHGINKRDMQVFLELKAFYRIPFIRAENFYTAEYNCKIPYTIQDIREGLSGTLEKIVRKELALS